MIRRTKVYLRGAYGPGNLGDDVLMLAMIKILKSIFKTRDISVAIENIEEGKVIDSEINWVPLNAPIIADITILGGGGQFFSFKNQPPSRKGGLFDKFKQKRKEGYTFIDFVVGIIFRTFLKIGYYSKEIGVFCIGVGPFENGPDLNYNKAKAVLSKAGFISVRDGRSKELAVKLSNRKVYQHTDLTLKRDLWQSEIDSTPINDSIINEIPTVGIIIREWELNAIGKDIINDLINFAKDNDQYKYVYISLYKKYDAKIIDDLKNKKLLIWDPLKFTVDAFINEIKNKCNIIVSSRAHGVLLPTMVYIPSIAVEIEPKLRAVHEMLPNATKIITKDEFGKLDHYIKEMLSIDKQQFITSVENDLSSSSQLIEQAVIDLKYWLEEIVNNEK